MYTTWYKCIVENAESCHETWRYRNSPHNSLLLLLLLLLFIIIIMMMIIIIIMASETVKHIINSFRVHCNHTYGRLHTCANA